MDELKEQLSEKGRKCNLQFSTSEKDYYKAEAGFTDEEVAIFDMRSRGFSIQKIAIELAETNHLYYSLGVIENRIRSIKSKILRLL